MFYIKQPKCYNYEEKWKASKWEMYKTYQIQIFFVTDKIQQNEILLEYCLTETIGCQVLNESMINGLHNQLS